MWGDGRGDSRTLLSFASSLSPTSGPQEASTPQESRPHELCARPLLTLLSTEIILSPR